MAVGILAVQGAFREHGDCLDKLGAEYRFIRNRSDIDDSIDRLILPGGESTVQRKLLNELDLFEPLKKLIESDVPVMGTCAGLILLAQTITNGDESVFGTLPVEVCRNAYGRQLGSFSASGNIGEVSDFCMRFIRAPFIKKVLSDDVEILNTTDDKITAVRYKKQLGFAFKDISEHLPGAFIIYRADKEDDELFYANHEFLSMTGYQSMDEFFRLTNKSFHNLIREDEQQQIEASIWEQIDSGNENDYIHFHLRKADGSYLSVLDHGRIVESPQYGKVFYVLFMDWEDMHIHYSDKFSG